MAYGDTVKSEQRWKEEAARAQNLADTMTGIMRTASTNVEQGYNYTVREMLDEAFASLEHRLDDQPHVKSDVLLAIGRAYHSYQLTNKAAECFRARFVARGARLESRKRRQDRRDLGPSCAYKSGPKHCKASR